MLKNAAFTICAKNYIGLAKVLGESINRVSPDIAFFIIIADEPSVGDSFQEKNIFIAKDILSLSEDEWTDMSFKYDLTEFCTSIKPFCFEYLMNKYDKCIYFDPDILVFNNLDYILEKLNDHSILLTPHITEMETYYTGSLSEQSLLYSGVFNLGFIAIKNDNIGKNLISWWGNRLKDRCFRIKSEHYFTDQKWMDFLPSFLGNDLFISFNLGLNVAPWNFHEREIIMENNYFFVVNRKKPNEKYILTFVHFSGYNYSKLIKGDIINQNLMEMDFPTDFQLVFNEYSRHLNTSNFKEYISLPYTYNYFKTGENITSTIRRLYRRLSEDNAIAGNPFSENSQIYKLLKKRKIISNKMIESDDANIRNVNNIDRKFAMINKLFNLFFNILGPVKYFMLVRLLRLYSITENHIFVVKKYNGFKIKN